MNYQVITYSADKKPIEVFDVCSQAKTAKGVLRNVELHLERKDYEFSYFAIQLGFFYEDVSCRLKWHNGTAEMAQAVMNMLPDLSRLFEYEK